MEKSVNIKRQIYICYAVALAAAVSLFFVGRYEAGFSGWIHQHPKDDMSDLLPNLSLTKIALFVLDFNLWLVIASPLPIEDERVEKIRAFALKQTFVMGIIAVICLGMLIPGNFNPLVYILILQCFYLLSFRLYLYRDSRIVYLTVAQQEAKVKANKKKMMIFILSQSAVMGALIAVAEAHHWIDIYWMALAIYLGLLLLIGMVYNSWKS